MALIGKTVTTGASQALASLCGTGGEAEGPGHSAGETDTCGGYPAGVSVALSRLWQDRNYENFNPRHSL